MVKNRRVSAPKGGDIFTIPLDDDRVALGQVISSFHAAYYIVVFECTSLANEIPLQIPEALRSRPFLAGLTFAALIRHGHWTVVENRPVDSKKFLPAYKTGTDKLGNCMIEDFKGQVWRPATALEEKLIPFREITSPIRFEKAMKAHIGLEPWDESI
ncbi:immunity 26/phosphotriesterase HocA family protein [Arthrobacter zhaoxinii]|uniref:Immunity 26/phosphotriesterase HocA family protein n=1 Tax=Arthrobacter zhaoxinii TaxID=2964616 RepID=A0ABY5YTN4_9MICC|nr:immunity 26/phosphotriesterase HocA family protein [Arthrobacter zhaoxinii]UWX98482.1 immunity 26/phosphotriesterase HocA family protein [Arthrobacter zhaoxinii]